MKKIPVLVLVSLLFVTILMPEIQIADGFSETHQIHPNGVGGISHFELQAGDRVEVSFSLSNMGPYIAMVPDMDIIATREAYYSVDVSFGGPAGNIMNFTDTRGESFSYTALDGGYYWFTAYCSSGAWFADPKNPEMALNYDIIKAKTPTPSAPVPTPSSVMQPQSFSAVYTAGILAALVIAVTVSIMLLFYRRQKANAKPPKAYN